MGPVVFRHTDTEARYRWGSDFILDALRDVKQVEIG